MALKIMLHRSINHYNHFFTCKINFLKMQTKNTAFKNLHLKGYSFDSNEEIIENFLTKVMLIGINLPEQKNILNENALDMLNESIKKFSLEKDLNAAVLHGCGGNFCTGIQSNEINLKKGEKLIKSLHDLKKPIVVSLNGYTTDFGFQLATMCDLKAMDETALIGFGSGIKRTSIPDEVFKRLVATVGLSAAMLMVLTTCTWNAQDAMETNFVNRTVSCGASLGQAITWAKSIALGPLESTIEQKLKILSLI